MLTNKKLDFAHKTILTSSMLREIYKYPREFFRLLYQNFSNGIICGADYFIEDGNLFLSAGVIRLDGDFYFLENNLNISALAEKNKLEIDNTYYISLEKNSRQVEPCLTENNFVVTFEKENKFPALGNFFFMGANKFALPALNFGKNMKNPFENIFLRTVLNLSEVEFAAEGGATFHPLLFRLVKDFLTDKKYKTPFDFAILTQILNHGVISLQTIKNYIVVEDANFNFESCTRTALFEEFCACLFTSKFNPSYAAPEAEIENTGMRRTSRPYGKLL